MTALEEEMGKKRRLLLPNLPKRHTDVQYETNFRRCLASEISIVMNDRVKNFKRSKAGKAYVMEEHKEKDAEGIEVIEDEEMSNEEQDK